MRSIVRRRIAARDLVFQRQPHRGNRVADFMRHSGRHTPKRGKPFVPRQFGGQPARLRQRLRVALRIVVDRRAQPVQFRRPGRRNVRRLGVGGQRLLDTLQALAPAPHQHAQRNGRYRHHREDQQHADDQGPPRVGLAGRHPRHRPCRAAGCQRTGADQQDLAATVATVLRRLLCRHALLRRVDDVGPLSGGNIGLVIAAVVGRVRVGNKALVQVPDTAFDTWCIGQHQLHHHRCQARAIVAATRCLACPGIALHDARALPAQLLARLLQPHSLGLPIQAVQHRGHAHTGGHDHHPDQQQLPEQRTGHGRSGLKRTASVRECN